jgi:hypothetical protein
MTITISSKETRRSETTRFCIHGCGRPTIAANVAKCVVCLTREINALIEDTKASA